MSFNATHTIWNLSQSIAINFPLELASFIMIRAEFLLFRTWREVEKRKFDVNATTISRLDEQNVSHFEVSSFYFIAPCCPTKLFALTINLYCVLTPASFPPFHTVTMSTRKAKNIDPLNCSCYPQEKNKILSFYCAAWLFYLRDLAVPIVV